MFYKSSNLTCRNSERGGIAILTVLALLVVATVLAFSLSKTSIRELSTTGTVWHASKASEAAEAGLDWFLLWTNKDNISSATAAGRQTLLSAFRELNEPGTWQTSTFRPTGTNIWDRLNAVTADLSVASEMVFDNSTADFKQSTTGNATIQSFNLAFRYLGECNIRTVSSGSGHPAGPSSAKSGREVNLYQLNSAGRASVPLGSGNYMSYQANREMFLTALP